MDVDIVVDGVEVAVRAEPGATVGDLRRGLAGIGLPDAPLSVGAGRVLPDDAPLAGAGLHHGVAVHTDGRAGWTLPPDRAAGWEIAVVGGLHGGRTATVGPGERAGVGRSPRSRLRIPDHEVSREHAEVRVSPDGAGAELVDRDSANGIRLGAWRLDAPGDLTTGQVFAIGESVVAARRPGDEPVGEVTADGATRLFNRPPRITPPDRLPELLVPVEPVRPRGFRFPLAATLAPALLCGALYLFLPAGGFGGYLIVMMALSPLMAVANLVADRRSGRREYARAMADYGRAREAFDAELAAAAGAQEAADRAAHPDPSTVVGRTRPGRSRPAASLWQRRPADADFLTLRIGLVDRPARLILRPDAASAGGVDEPLPVLHDVPLTVSLPEAGVLGVAGPRSTVLAAGRALLAQAAILHSPAELGILVITGRDTAPDWEWTTWLPHTLPASSAFACRRLVATDAAQAEARLAELRRLIEERATQRRTALHQGPPAGRTMLVVLDGAHRLRDLAGLAEVLATGPAAGVHALCLDDREHSLPDECAATVVVGPEATRATVRRAGFAPVADVLIDGLTPEPALAAARALAPLRLLGERGQDAALPDRARLLDVIDTGEGSVRPGGCLGGAGEPSAAAVRRRWAAQPHGRSTVAQLGLGAAGPVSVDIRRDGPHALVAGTSGAGKSELLRTFVASLALANTPDALTFVLVDYKGGSAFAACADLPHCVGLITDLDGHLVSRALDSLSAELRRREELFAAAGATDIEDYWLRTGARLPRLVIVVDEFASLVEELPEFVPGVVGIGMRGRSLGVHVVLATQRPAGVVTADLRANLNLRVALRVTSTSDSQDVIDVPDAARIPHRLPGRAFLRTGHAELTEFQAALVSWPRPSGAPAGDGGAPVTVTRRRIDALGLPERRAGHGGDEAVPDTDLTALVAAIRDAAAESGLTTPPRPWLPPLPEVVTLASVSTPGAAAIGLVDRPAAQAQVPFVLELERTGPVAVAGAVRAGRSTVLRTLAVALAEDRSPADLHLYALDCGNQALAPLAALPHCGAVVDGDDAARTERLLAMLHAEVVRRQRLLTAAGHGSFTETSLPLVVLLLDRLEAFVNRYAETDGGRLVDRLESLLRTGPAAGVTVVLSTDRTGFGHRVASAVAARLVLRQASPDDAAAFGVDPRGLPRHLPPGRGVWGPTGEHVQVAVLDPDPGGAAQATAVARAAAALGARWDGVAERFLPQRLDRLPDEINTAEAEALRVGARPAGPAVCSPAVGGDRLGPVDVDLADAGGSFLVAGPQRAGRSTALMTIAATLAGRRTGDLPVLAVAPRPSPLRDLAGGEGVLDVLTGDPQEVAAGIADALAAGPFALVVDDGELLGADYELAELLDGFARDARDRGCLLVAAVTTEDVLANPYRGWLATARRPRSGLLLNPASHLDGDVFGLRLPRSTGGGWPRGRALLALRGEATTVHITTLASADAPTGARP
ncbi:FtsK/SpoIIIE domain-containing protein [Luedemannella helvata]|uniref:FtsK/SpoIIIE domain-containing protein n=1 Tax=Luedemannella helvata TaxID=349315 RepID=A0ABN2KFV0_9ACTN